MTIFIGDTHGLYDRYGKIIDRCKNSVQVGDMGVGFFTKSGVPCPNPPYDKMIKGGHRWIRGNHDNPNVCKTHTQWIRDGHTEITPKGTKIMYIGGAWSIDQTFRTEPFDWWYNEELSHGELLGLLDKYQQFCPDVMVTHDCPEAVAYELFLARCQSPVYKTRTGQALQGMFNHIIKPKIWIFGHWHSSRDIDIHGTRFICLNELETIDLNL